MNKRNDKRELYITFLSNLKTEKKQPAPIRAARTQKPLVTQVQQFIVAVATKAKRLAFA